MRLMPSCKVFEREVVTWSFCGHRHQALDGPLSRGFTQKPTTGIALHD